MTTKHPHMQAPATVPVTSSPSPSAAARSDSLSHAIREAMHHEPGAAVVFAGADGRPVYWSRAFAEAVQGAGPNEGSRQLAAATALVRGNGEKAAAPVNARGTTPAQALRAADGTVVGMKYRLTEHDREARPAPAGDADANHAWIDELTTLLRQAVEYGARALTELAAHPVCDGVLLARLCVQRAIALAEQGRGLEMRRLRAMADAGPRAGAAVC